ncbi:MAG: GntR family transcriptional regulator [Armatimonadetes bacterium]|nr:GntR family transcriptional regulator [Candidatus Hippobium faecium]
MTKTKYAENYIRNKIMSGQWKEGFVLPNTVDLAKEIGVSKFTLSEAFKPLAEQGIIVRKTKVGTVVRKICDKNQGIILTIGSSSHITDYAGGYIQQAFISRSQAYLEKTALNFKIAVGVGDTMDKFMDSMHIFNDTALLNDTIGVLNTLGWFPLDEFHKRKIPTVSFSAFYGMGRNEIIVDVCSVFRQAVNMLQSHKSKKICILNMDFTAHSVKETHISVKKDNLIKDTLDDLMCLYDNVDVLNLDVSKIVYGKVYDIFRKYCTENPNLDAIFIGDDSMLVEVFRVIWDLHLRVPEDLKISAGPIRTEITVCP